jgi:DNA repair protein RadA/Sms
MGRCPSCGEWNTLVEERESPPPAGLSGSARAVSIDRIPEENFRRIPTGFQNLDQVLGGGLVPGQVILIAGEPGIGKSTLLLQVSKRFGLEGSVLYVSGEESESQIAMRARRIDSLDRRVLVLADTVFENVERVIKEESPVLVVIDSIQTLYSRELESSAGSVSQVREVAFRLSELCKEFDIPCFIVGQVTKEGMIAGPKVLEHLVDTVLYFEGERFNFHRVIKVVKNRFGQTGEVAVFRMSDRGLEEVSDPSAFFIEHRVRSPGSVIFPYTEGTKPILLEVQALVIPALYTTPQRKTQGYELGRLPLILAVLEKEAKVFTRDSDVFVNVAGGMAVREPACDLAVALAIASSKKDRPIPEDTVVFGELGLAGEVRPVHFGELRLQEAMRFGFKRALVPKAQEVEGGEMEVIGVSSISEAVELVL